jgi:basic membrane lipoprotein Med (substrate-binding protein (PBP1-ABC) superfamily)
VRKNVAPIRLMLEESSYLAGMLAAYMSQTGHGGLVGGIEIPAVKSTFLAFIAGAKAVKPNFVAPPPTSEIGKTWGRRRRRRWR